MDKVFSCTTFYRSFVILTLAVLMATSAAAATFKLRYSDLGPPRGPRAEVLMWWADEIKKQTEGQVEVEFFWSQSLVKAKETLKAVGSGLIDTGTILGVYTPADLPLWNLANAPFGGRDPWVGMATWQELRRQSKALRDETQKKNVKILSNFTTGSVDLLSKKPIRSRADLKGLKIRATGGWAPLLQKLGATPVRIGFGELYQALDKGTVDATINYIFAVKAYKHYEVAHYMTIVQMGQVLGYGIGINLRTWKKMPKEIQTKLEEVSDQLIIELAHKYQTANSDATKAMSAGIDGNTVTFSDLPEAERNQWKDASDFFIKDWLAKVEKKGVDGQKFVAQMNAIRTKYEAELKDNGYPWER